MIINDAVLTNEEKAIYTLRTLYNNHGYHPYKMSKFEAYDLYVRNKDFLVSDEIITFTDTGGRLMALKPDVTLSIIKNNNEEPGLVEKLYYDEHVYRVAKGTGMFKEVLQAGLECIGDLTQSDVDEVVRLAADSLRCISHETILDLSHMGIVSAVVDDLGLSAQDTSKALKLIGSKNTHELRKLCKANDVFEEKAEALCTLVGLYGKPETVLPQLRELFTDSVISEALDQLENTVGSFHDPVLREMLRIDFSVVNDMKYYNGIVFTGFVNGIPDSVLSGGQYDGLMQRMHHRGKAVGFAVYLDLLERLPLACV